MLRGRINSVGRHRPRLFGGGWEPRPLMQRRANPFYSRSFCTTTATTSATTSNGVAAQPAISNRRFSFRFAALALTGGAAVWYQVKDTSFEPEPLKELRTATKTVVRGGRTLLTMAAIAADYKYTWWRYKPIEGDAVSEQMAKEQTSQVHKRSAERLLRLCQTNKGLYIKVGQYLSSMVIPREYTTTLRVLQDQAPSVDFSVVRQVFMEDLGHPPEHFFKEFEEKPLAAASLAQVHRAITHDGREVAVKVQYPNLRVEFAGDMWTHETVLKIAPIVFEGFDLAWAHEEIESNLVKELDFENEGRNAERCARNFKDNPRIYVPKIYWDLTSKRILGMEFIHGLKITQTEKIKEDLSLDVAAVVGTAIKAMAEQIYVHGFVHCDPHPGNLFVRRTPCSLSSSSFPSSPTPSSSWLSSLFSLLHHPQSQTRAKGGKKDFQLVILDHGLYRQLSEKTRITYCRLWESLILRDDVNVAKHSKALGVDNWNLFAILVLMRPYATSSGVAFSKQYVDFKKLLNKQPQTEAEAAEAEDNSFNDYYKLYSQFNTQDKKSQLLEEMQRAMFQQVTEVFQMMKQMPRELLLVMRNQNYLRALNKELGEPVNRFAIMARTAVQGIHHRNPIVTVEKVQGEEKLVSKVADELPVRSNRMSALASTLRFELNLVLSDWLYWLTRWYLSLILPKELLEQAEFNEEIALEV
ncbi:putative aarF domain-containing protein kinase 5, variant 2 [Balamuthia mandrillaris]